MAEREERKSWSFPGGSVGHDESVKDYAVEATDGQVGSVSWASYAPGESYLVVSYKDGHHHVHHVVPAGAVKTVDHERRAVTLGVTVAEVEATPTHEHPEAPVDWALVEQFDRGMLSGGGIWPYTDV
jgi:ADP-ribose pyrophosphatase YjhB (NUDIX family)